jgi:hypothetical protein
MTTYTKIWYNPKTSKQLSLPDSNCGASWISVKNY